MQALKPFLLRTASVAALLAAFSISTYSQLALPNSAKAQAADAQESDFAEALTFYYQNDMGTARDMLERVAENSPGDAEVLAWLAEATRRQGHYVVANRIARDAVEIDPGNAWAHSVLAATYNPQYKLRPGANADSCWVHLLASVECDPAEASAWLTIWGEAMRRGESALEEASIRSIVDHGFLTPCVLDYARWMLADLPPDAVLLVNGDMDTYPPLAIQLVDDFRTDVVVINLSMLNMPWYATLLCDRYGLPFPYPREEMDEVDYEFDDDELITASKKFVRAWLNQYHTGEFTRPIAVSTTVPVSEYWNDPSGHLLYSGPYWLVHREELTRSVDVETCRKSLETASGLDFSGSFVSDIDRSPIRHKGSPYLATNPAAGAIHLAKWYIDEGRSREALELLDWVERFEKDTEVGFVHELQVAGLRRDAANLGD